MASTSMVIPTPGDNDLPTLQTVVQQMEDINGTLLAISSYQNNTWLTISTGPSPDKQIVLEQYASGQPPAKPGHQLVCIGDCYIESQDARVAAYRPV